MFGGADHMLEARDPALEEEASDLQSVLKAYFCGAALSTTALDVPAKFNEAAGRG